MFTPAERHFFSARFSSRMCTTNSSSSSLSRFPGKSRFALPGADFARGRERKRAKDESDSWRTTFLSRSYPHPPPLPSSPPPNISFSASATRSSNISTISSILIGSVDPPPPLVSNTVRSRNSTRKYSSSWFFSSSSFSFPLTMTDGNAISIASAISMYVSKYFVSGW